MSATMIAALNEMHRRSRLSAHHGRILARTGEASGERLRGAADQLAALDLEPMRNAIRRLRELAEE